MPKISQPPTPYPQINVLLHRLLTELQSALGDNLLGLYLYGSLASGDFDERSGDVDFVAVTQTEISADEYAKLVAVHDRIAASGLKWASKLEGSYISRAALRRYNPDDPPRPTLNEGQFYLDRHGDDWIIQRHILRKHGVPVFGPSIRPWIDPVSPGQLRGAVAGILFGWWDAHILADPSELLRPGYQPFAVLTMCRALYAFAHGEIVSKPASARWALENLDPRWRPLIEQALTLEPGTSPQAVSETESFIRYTLQQAAEWKGQSAED